MDSRERVLAAISHQAPDRVPCDLWAEPGVWERLKRDLGVRTEEDVRNVLDVDIRHVFFKRPGLVRGLENILGCNRKGFEEAMELARQNDKRGILAMRRAIKSNPASEDAKAARAVLKEMGAGE